MKTICLYFQIHQPFRLKRYRFFDIGKDDYYFDDYTNEFIIRKVTEKCYLPTNQILLKLINKYPGQFKVAFSISGIALEQFDLYAPEVLDSFKELSQTGQVEFLAETYAHSLVALKDESQFRKQVKMHKEKIEALFGQTPTVFRNTELVYSDEMGAVVADMGFKAMLTEGAKHILGWKSPNFLYCNAINPRLKVLLRNFKLSDDITFRFGNQDWSEWPLTPKKYVSWMEELGPKEELINLFVDYETFGEHQWEETGIFQFLESLPKEVLKKGYTFSTPSEVAADHQPVGVISVPHPISWADEERDLTAWLGNELQEEAWNKLYKLYPLVAQCPKAELKKIWLFLQTSDHFYYMCTKFFSDGEVHAYFNPFESPYDAFMNYMNVLSDFEIRLNRCFPQSNKDQEITHLIWEIENKEEEIHKLKKRLKDFKESVKKASKKKKSTNTSI